MSTSVRQASDQQVFGSVAAMEHSGCSSLAQALVDTASGGEPVGLDAGIRALLEPSSPRVVFLYTPPEMAVANALFEGLDPVGFLEEWVSQHQLLLGYLKRHRGRWVLLDASEAGVDPGAAISAIGASPQEQALSPVAAPPMALEHLLTAGAVQAAPDAQRIAAHLTALSTPVHSDQAEPPKPEDALREYLDRQAESRLQTDAWQRSEREALRAQTLAERARVEEEGLAAARQAQIEQLNASRAITEQQLADRQAQLDETTHAKTDAEALARARQAEIEQLCAAKAAADKLAAERQGQIEQIGQAKAQAEQLAAERQTQIEQIGQAKAQAEQLAAERQTQIEQIGQAKTQSDQLAAECQSQLDQAAKALETQRAEVAELKSESELLLLQLHQVQEELESWFLKTKDVGEELQQAKQSGRAALEEAKARLDQARQNKDIAEKLARERYDVIRELRLEKRRLESALALPVEEPRAEQAPAPQKPAIDPAKTPVSQSVMHEEQARAAAPSRATGLGGLFHRGRRIKGLKKKDVSVIRTSELFDADWYLETHTDVAEAGFDAAEHYLAFGYAEGRNPSPYFDGASYLALNPDVSAAGDNPLLHYLKFGKTEGRAMKVSDAG